MKTYLAVDIGASSRRHILGWLEDGKLKLKEIYRFKNGAEDQNGHLYWDIDRLESEVIDGIAACETAARECGGGHVGSGLCFAR